MAKRQTAADAATQAATDAQAAEATEEEEAPVTSGDVFPAGIRESYERGTTDDGASFIDNGDTIAQQLRGWELIDVAKEAAKRCGQRNAQGWLDFYGKDRTAAGKKPLNAGMVRMNLGNRIRAAMKKEAAKAAS
jgi:hypothetical protein